MKIDTNVLPLRSQTKNVIKTLYKIFARSICIFMELRRRRPNERY